MNEQTRAVLDASIRLEPSISQRCVGYSATSEDDTCTTKPKFVVHARKFGAPEPFVTCGRHLSWAVDIWLRKRGQVIAEIERFPPKDAG